MAFAILAGMFADARAHIGTHTLTPPVADSRLLSRYQLPARPFAATHFNDGFLVVEGGNSRPEDDQRSILRFDMPTGNIPTGDGILRLQTEALLGDFASVPVQLYKIKSSNAGWIEAPTASNFEPPNSNGYATWNNLAENDMLGLQTAWTGGPGLGAPGTGGYEGETAGSATPLDSVLGGDLTVGTFVDFTVPMSVLNEWFSNPASNAGFMLRSPDANEMSSVFYHIQFRSGEFSTGTPQLIVPTIPEPGSLALVAIGVTYVAGRRCHRGRRWSVRE
ncbi:MAG: hypothetical protein WD738_17015 [Pirellulales bacterium]